MARAKARVSVEEAIERGWIKDPATERAELIAKAQQAIEEAEKFTIPYDTKYLYYVIVGGLMFLTGYFTGLLERAH